VTTHARAAHATDSTTRRACYDSDVAILIDEPLWWFSGRRWSHLVSDTSLDELIAFADAAGIPRRGFQGDHYDVPEEYYSAMVAAGAMPTPSRELLRRLKAAGLRLDAAQRRARRADHAAAEHEAVGHGPTDR
jgi:hypothetical protein